ncbi:hypothetical protein VQ02_10135 [Methylobacterium variabile]|jgi:hypothetical protein|uniref:Uncharacterized protein n=1 Tax=Methylobacterium variabile TaxID=298794 RepID=A0A0J6VJI8_9HYPH|nr:hypothetical protein [Methylobacterium variabile]KMO39291.1 hypothetical protein VQ02_10135 [Methylobacterium variabile]
MSRGLGIRQRAFLSALARLDRDGPARWHTPGEVLAAMGPLPLGRAERMERHFDRADRAQLAHLRELAAAGYQFAVGGIAVREAEIANRERRWRWNAPRAPNTTRIAPRGGEAVNPSRVLALLAKRGLVEREAHCGPGSQVRLLK